MKIALFLRHQNCKISRKILETFFLKDEISYDQTERQRDFFWMKGSYLYLFDTYCSLVRIFGKSNVVLLLLYLRSVEPAVWVKDELRKCHVIFSLYQSTDREKCNANYTEPWKTKIRIHPVFAYSKFNTQTKPQGTCLQVNSCAGKFNTVSAKALKLKPKKVFVGRENRDFSTVQWGPDVR